MKRVLKYLLYPIEAIALSLIMLFALVIPFTWGSKIGSFLGGFLGPKISGVNKIAQRNFELSGLVFSKKEEKQILKKMWQNLGRTLFECVRLPYQNPFGKKTFYEIEGIEHLDALIQDGKTGLLFSAHYGNWEVGTYIAQKRGLVVAQITRFLNNPLSRFVVNAFHNRLARKVIPKGADGARQIIRELKAGNHVSMLADQKMNDGISVPFFGREAMTAPAFAKMALKFNCPLVPFQVIREKGVKCKVIYYPPLIVPETGTSQEKTMDLLQQMNKHIEMWVRQHPEQWFWIHRRWPKDLYKKGSKT